MKFISYAAIISIILLSCKQPDNNLSQTQNETNKIEYKPIDKKEVALIKLLIADTSIIDPVNKELPPLLNVGFGGGFVDSTGTAMFKPSQQVVIENYKKDSMVDIFNTYLDKAKKNDSATNCDILYLHSFNLYDSSGKMIEQVNLCLGCSKFYFLKRGAFIQFLENDKETFDKLINALEELHAYIPIYLKEM